MITFLSLVTSVKDYLSVVHKLVETDAANTSFLTSYTEIGPVITYFILSLKDLFTDVFSLSFIFKNLWNLPVIIPEISSAMISEISVLDGYFHNAFQFLETPISYGDQNLLIYSISKFGIGLVNSFFLFLPTTTAHIITLRRFVMQGLEAGYISGLGTICGNILWFTCVIFGCRFFVIPWLSLDIFRYVLGFLLLIKYMWDSYNERRMVLEDLSKQKIFLFNFLLALTEQTSIYPFVTNLSFGPDASILESFPAQNLLTFYGVHAFYIAGLLIGSLSLLHFTCWFWENPAFKIYMWVISSFKVSTSFYYLILNFVFLYLTMISAITSIPYYGLDYTITNPLGLVNEDRLIQDKTIQEFSFLGTKASDRNTRRNRGRHGRRERWKRRIRKYRTFDASLYDQGIYDLFTIEDLNYGFDRFWLRRKLRNHRVRFRFFPGPWMRSFKKQLAKPRLESYTGPRIEFFRILFEQVYHPSFHSYNNTKKDTIKQTGSVFLASQKNANTSTDNLLTEIPKKDYSIYNLNIVKNKNSSNLSNTTNSNIYNNSALRKFVRKANMRLKTGQIALSLKDISVDNLKDNTKQVYSKRWKQIFSRISNQKSSNNQIYLSTVLQNFYKNKFQENSNNSYNNVVTTQLSAFTASKKQNSALFNLGSSEESIKNKAPQQILRYRSLLLAEKSKSAYLANSVSSSTNANILLHPFKYYQQKEKSFSRKLRYYTPAVFRKFSVENNAPYFRVLMKRYFYYYKPTLRWEKTMKVASLRKARRKTSRIPRKFVFNNNNAEINNLTTQSFATQNKSLQFDNTSNENFAAQSLALTYNDKLVKPTSDYSVISKKASRYRYQIYKDVLQHWYYSPFNRFLLKLDVDSFIRRQPNSHFLTKNEENLLHLRRFLLSEHYDTLRWYTNMQQYRTMKTQIGGTKSFASKAYNQQFSGTFKKIRHLFAITPSFIDNNSVLKFDQPLYNEYTNTAKQPFVENFIIHEELVNNKNLLPAEGKQSLSFDKRAERRKPTDLIDQSQEIIRTYLTDAAPLRQEYIKQLLKEKDYLNLSQFLLNGQKLRGNQPITNDSRLLEQEKNYLFTNQEKEEFQRWESRKLTEFLRENNLQQDITFNFFRKWKHSLNDQEFLKNYITGRVEKREKRKQSKEKQFISRFNLLKQKLNSENQTSLNQLNTGQNSSNPQINTQKQLLTTGLQKSIFDGISVLDGLNKVNKKALSYEEKSVWKLLVPTLRYKIKTNSSNLVNKENIFSTDRKLNYSQLNFAKTLKLKTEIQTSLNTLSTIVEKSKQTSNLSITKVNTRLLNSLNTRLGSIYSTFRKKVNKLVTINLLKFVKPIKRKTLSNWKKKERFLSKQKRLRKEFKKLAGNKIALAVNTQNTNKSLSLAGGPLENSFNLAAASYQNSDFNRDNKRQKRDFAISETTVDPQYAVSLTSDARKDNNISSLKDNIINSYVSRSARANTLLKLLSNKRFKRKRTPQRRSRGRRGRVPIKKRTLLLADGALSDLTKKEIKALFFDSAKDSNLINSEASLKKFYLLQKQNNNLENNKSPLMTVEFTEGLKQRKSAIRRQRSWKQKRGKFAQKRRNYRKRRRYIVGKIRTLSKKLQKMKAKVAITNWWWKQYLPNLQATTDALWQIEKDRQIQQKLTQFQLNNETNLRNQSNNKENSSLQIGDLDFKPLFVPQAMNIKEELQKETQQNYSFEEAMPRVSLQSSISQNQTLNRNSANLSTSSVDLVNNQNTTIINKLYENLLLNKENNNFALTSDTNNKIMSTISTPFYAGWDESQRKFIVTNRLLSRKEAGFSIPTVSPLTAKLFENNYLADTNLLFTEAPLKGMNAATTLYWQIPFTTYDTDQFFVLGMDGFSPIGWRRFQFRHSILKSWLYNYSKQNNTFSSANFNKQKTKRSEQNKKESIVINKINSLNTSNTESSLNNSALLTIVNTKFSSGANKFSSVSNSDHKSTEKNISRRLKKRYRRVKKHPKTPSRYPTGPLLNQVLPVHYIYVFYKRSRLPRDRYLKRRLLNSRVTNSTNPQNLNYNLNLGNNSLDSKNYQLSVTNIFDLTLQKRVKTKRKYHRKRHFNTIIIPRRFSFVDNQQNNDVTRWRPISPKKLNKPIADLVKETQLRQKQKRNEFLSKQPANLRVKQLRRRVQRQIIRTIWRYRPRAGGFVWPGDYLRLELVKAPKLSVQKQELDNSLVNSTESKDTAFAKGKMKRKKKRTIQEWQLQPKKYLLQKHNIKVLKNKLKKAQRNNKLKQKIKELTFNIN